MLCEVLQGLDSERAALEVEALLRRFEIVPMAGDAIAVAAARNFRSLRRRGITVRKTVDLLIGTWCIENSVPLLHNDSDFHPMARLLGLDRTRLILTRGGCAEIDLAARRAKGHQMTIPFGELKARLLANPEVKAEYHALAPGLEVSTKVSPRLHTRRSADRSRVSERKLSPNFSATATLAKTRKCENPAPAATPRPPLRVSGTSSSRPAARTSRSSPCRRLPA